MILMTVQGVSKSFGMKSVLKDISLTLQQGARMGLIGVNGSGKSTLFRLIAGQMEPDEGTISLMRGTRVGMLTQEADIQSDLTVREELSRVFEPVREMERRLRALEEEMAQKHEDEAELDRLSREYARLTDRFEDAGGYEWPSRIQGVLAGGDAWDCNDANKWTPKLNEYKDDPQVVNAMREATKRILYTVANSNAMNGVSPNMQIVEVRTWWQNAFIVADVVFGALLIVSVVMLVRGRKSKQTANK